MSIEPDREREETIELILLVLAIPLLIALLVYFA